MKDHWLKILVFVLVVERSLLLQHLRGKLHRSQKMKMGKGGVCHCSEGSKSDNFVFYSVHDGKSNVLQGEEDSCNHVYIKILFNSIILNSQKA